MYEEISADRVSFGYSEAILGPSQGNSLSVGTKRLHDKSALKEVDNDTSGHPFGGWEGTKTHMPTNYYIH